ncbi:MAG: hypothetical protein ACOYVD_07055 [Bacillota bacterium]
MKGQRAINYFSVLVIVLVIATAIFIMQNGLGLIEGLDFGPGQYYYTDIPGWEKIFFGEKSINIGTDNPLLFFGIFFIWGFACYKFLVWIDKKWKHR